MTGLVVPSLQLFVESILELVETNYPKFPRRVPHLTELAFPPNKSRP